MKVILSICFILSLLSCSSEIMEDNMILEKGNSILTKSMLESVNDLNSNNGLYKQNFSIALAQAMSESLALRHFIKYEALKMFDKDYDILYYKLRNTLVDGERTFRDLLLPYFNKVSDLDDIESNCPLLTILVTNLPNDIFSAESWNIETESPYVAYIPDGVTYFNYVRSDGSEFHLDKGHLLFSPFVIVKLSDRVSVSGVTLTKSQDQSVPVYDFCFNLPFFDPNVQDVTKTKAIVSRPKDPMWGDPNSYVPQKLVDAYNIYKTSDGWQRDYIYYGLSPSKTHGAFSYDFQEAIHSFELIADKGEPSKALFNYLSDSPEDPELAGIVSEGYFEFMFRCYVNGTNGVGNISELTYQVDRNDLFIIQWNQTSGDPTTGPAGYISSIQPKRVEINLPIFNWDLSQYSSSIKISVEEVDPSGHTLVSEEFSGTVATNFEATSAGFEKIGLKFGTSSTQTYKYKLQRVVYHENDALGDVTINFGDKFFIDYELYNPGIPGLVADQYTTREYSSGMISLDVWPIKVQ